MTDLLMRVTVTYNGGISRTFRFYESTMPDELTRSDVLDIYNRLVEIETACDKYATELATTEEVSA